jgi:hypothetical protein
MCAQSCDVKVKDFESLDDVEDVVRTEFWKASGSVYMHGAIDQMSLLRIHLL